MSESSSTLKIETARVFQPLLEPSRYKGAHGGRGSGKSHFFAGLMVERALREPGFRGVCIREVQKSLKQSAKRLIEDKIEEHGLGSLFDIQTAEIKTPGGGVIIFQGMQDHTAESIKSLEGFDVAWCEESQSLSQRSLTLLRPTIRKDGSELWFSWNPTRKGDPVDLLLRGDNTPTGAVVVHSNWDDNRWFPGVLEQERLDDLENRPEIYPHIWEGGYSKVVEGAYYALSLIRARQQGRISRVAADPLLPYKFCVDLGGTGAKSDAFVGWICQFVGREIRVLDYYEVKGQPLSSHIAWLRKNGYDAGNTDVILPHDGATNDRVIDISFESAFISAGYKAEVIPNQGRGAARMRIEVGRRLFPSIWFNESTTEAGRDALGSYHERIDDIRQIGLGPDHDEFSHCGDAFGLMCLAYGDGPRVQPSAIDKYRESHESAESGSWMSV